MQGCFRIDVLAGVDRVRGPTCVDGVLHFFFRVIAAADEFKPIDDLDWMEHFPDAVPELGKISQQVEMKSASLKLVT